MFKLPTRTTQVQKDLELLQFTSYGAKQLDLNTQQDYIKLLIDSNNQDMTKAIQNIY